MTKKFTLALKTLNRDMFGGKKGGATLQFCRSSVETHLMRCIKDVCITQEVSLYLYYIQKLVDHSKWERNTLAMKILSRDMFGSKKGTSMQQFCWPSVRTHHMGNIKDVCITQIVPLYLYYIQKTDASRRQYFGHLWTNALTSFVVSSIGTQLVNRYTAMCVLRRVKKMVEAQ